MPIFRSVRNGEQKKKQTKIQIDDLERLWQWHGTKPKRTKSNKMCVLNSSPKCIEAPNEIANYWEKIKINNKIHGISLTRYCRTWAGKQASFYGFVSAIRSRVVVGFCWVSFFFLCRCCLDAARQVGFDSHSTVCGGALWQMWRQQCTQPAAVDTFNLLITILQLLGKWIRIYFRKPFFKMAKPAPSAYSFASKLIFGISVS